MVKPDSAILQLGFGELLSGRWLLGIWILTNCHDNAHTRTCPSQTMGSEVCSSSFARLGSKLGVAYATVQLPEVIFRNLTHSCLTTWTNQVQESAPLSCERCIYLNRTAFGSSRETTTANEFAIIPPQLYNCARPTGSPAQHNLEYHGGLRRLHISCRQRWRDALVPWTNSVWATGFPAAQR